MLPHWRIFEDEDGFCKFPFFLHCGFSAPFFSCRARAVEGAFQISFLTPLILSSFCAILACLESLVQYVPAGITPVDQYPISYWHCFSGLTATVAFLQATTPHHPNVGLTIISHKPQLTNPCRTQFQSSICLREGGWSARGEQLLGRCAAVREREFEVLGDELLDVWSLNVVGVGDFHNFEDL